MATREPAAECADGGSNAEASRIGLGTRIRAARTRRMLTMDAVARAAGCSRAFLSRIERNESMPSVATLLELARALEMPVGELFEESGPERAVVLRAEERPRVADGGALLETLTREVATRKMVVHRLLLEEGEETVPKLQRRHDEATGVVLSGRARVSLEAYDCELDPGDSFYFDAAAPYRVESLGPGTCELILVHCQRSW